MRRYELRLPDPDRAAVRADFDAALRLDPHNIAARLDYAEALEKLADPAGAAEQYRLALETNRQYDPTEPKRLPEEKVKEIEGRSASHPGTAKFHLEQEETEATEKGECGLLSSVCSVTFCYNSL